MALIENVDPAIELIEHRFQGQEGRTGLAYLRSHAYFNQLPPADDCLTAFIDREFDRATGGNGSPALGRLIGVPDDLAEPVRRAVATTITAGYLAMMTTEDPPGSDWVSDRDARSLWRFWLDHLGPSATLAFGIPTRFADSVTRDGGRRLEAELGRLGLLPGLFRRRAVTRRCAELSRFGLVLRIGQTTACSDSEFERSQAAEAWSYES